MHSSSRTPGAVTLVLAVAACSSHAASSGTDVSGTLEDAGFLAKSAVAYVQTIDAPKPGFSNGPDGGAVIPPPATGKVQTLTILVTDNANVTCAAVKNGQGASYASLGELVLQVSAAEPVTASVYEVGAATSSSASVAYRATTASCGEGQGGIGTSGTVTIHAVGDASVSGSFSVTFGASDYLMQPAMGTLTGTFDVPFCQRVDAGVPEIPDGGVVCNP